MVRRIRWRLFIFAPFIGDPRHEAEANVEEHGETENDQPPEERVAQAAGAGPHFSTGSRRLSLFQISPFSSASGRGLVSKLTTTQTRMQIQKATPVRFMKGLRCVTTTCGRWGGTRRGF